MGLRRSLRQLHTTLAPIRPYLRKQASRENAWWIIVYLVAIYPLIQYTRPYFEDQEPWEDVVLALAFVVGCGTMMAIYKRLRKGGYFDQPAA